MSCCSRTAWSLLMVDERAQELYFEIAIGHGAEKLKDVRLKLGEGIAGWVAEHEEPLLVEDVRSDIRFSPRIDEFTQPNTHSVLCVPIKGREHADLNSLSKRLVLRSPSGIMPRGGGGTTHAILLVATAGP